MTLGKSKRVIIKEEPKTNGDFMKNKKGFKIYKIKVLDVKYQSELRFLGFRYIHYKIKARNEEDAMEEVRKLYMKGEEGEKIEEIPILLKIFSFEYLFS